MLANKKPDLLEIARDAREKSTTSVDIGLAAFVVVRLRDDDAKEFTALLSGVFEVVHENNVILEGVMFPFVLITTELLLTGAPTSGEPVATALQKELGRNAKIAYGIRRCARGLVGSANIMRYLSLYQSFADCIRLVEELQFGELRELV